MQIARTIAHASLPLKHTACSIIIICSLMRENLSSEFLINDGADHLTSLNSCRDWFESCCVGNLEEGFCRTIYGFMDKHASTGPFGPLRE